MPLMSGYRKSKSRRLIITTGYASAIYEIESGELSHLQESNLRVVFPQSEIVSARPFDLDVYRSLSA